MVNKFKLDIQEKVLEKISGEISYDQSREERERIVLDVLSSSFGMTPEESFFQSATVSELNTEEGRKQFLKEFFSYGQIDDLLKDPFTEDIIVNGLNYIYIHHAQRGLVKTDKRFQTRKELDLFVKKLIIFSGKRNLKHINNFELPDISGRINIVMSPFGPQVTITKIREIPLSIIDLIKLHSLNCEVAAQLWLYVEGMNARPANMLILGAPGSGKTTLMNALLSFVPPNERLVIIEDTLELNTQLEDSWSRLECEEGITLAALLKNSLRMRPDRLIVGEVRGEEAQDMMTAMNIGKYCMCTIHANSAREAIIRLQNKPMNIPETLINLIDVFITTKKIHSKNMITRVVSEVAESAGLEQKMVLLASVWLYDLEKAIFVQKDTSTVFRDKICSIAGFSPRQVIEELKIRTNILNILQQREINSINDVTDFCRLYHQDSDAALAKLGLKRTDLLR